MFVGWLTPSKSFEITSISHSEIVVICTNLANELGHHLVWDTSPKFDWNGDNVTQNMMVRLRSINWNSSIEALIVRFTNEHWDWVF